MDTRTIFTKTAKGLSETLGKTKALSRESRKILKEVDGKATLGEIIDKLDDISPAKIQVAMTKMLADDFVREFATAPEAQAAQQSMGDSIFGITSPAPLENALSQFTIGDFMRAMEDISSGEKGEGGDLSFKSLTEEPAPEQKAHAEEVLRKAQAAREQADAEQRAAAEAMAQQQRVVEERAKQEAEQQARIAAQEKARQEAEEKARREAEAMARRKAEEKAAREAGASEWSETIGMVGVQADLERARQEAEARAHRQAEEQAQREQAERLREEQEARARRLAIEEQRRKMEERAIQELQDQVRRDAEVKARQEAEESARRQAEEQARRKAEEKARYEAAEKARKEAEAQARREAEERAKKEAEEQARQKAWEAVRIAAEAQAKKEAEAKAKQEAEEKARQEAEEQARRKAEEKARKEAEAQARREAEEAARRAAEEQARVKAEEKARKAAEEKARKEAEAEAKRQAKERARQEAEEQARQKAEEKARKEAEEKARRDAEAKAKQEAEEKARREAEEKAKIDAQEKAARTAEEEARRAVEDAQRQAAAEQARREAEERARLAAEEKARQQAEKQAAIASGERVGIQPVRLAVAGVLVLLLLLGVAAITLQFVSFDSRIPQLETAAAEQFGHPVKIKKLKFTLLPSPGWRLEDVIIGEAAQVGVHRISAAGGIGSLFGGGIDFSTITLESPIVTEEGLGWLLFGRPGKTGFAVSRISATHATLKSQQIVLPVFDLRAEIGEDGNWQKMSIDATQEKLHLELQPKGSELQLEMSAESFALPFGGKLALDKFSASGSVTRGGLSLRELQGIAYDGVVKGNARLNWSGGWSLNGELTVRNLDPARLAPALFQSGALEADMRYTMQAEEGGKLMASPRGKGVFTVSNGTLAGVDLAGLLLGQSGGKTAFNSLGGDYAFEDGRLQLRRVQLAAGLTSASGSADLDAEGRLGGRFALDFKSAGRQMRGNLNLGGTLKEPQFSR